MIKLTIFFFFSVLFPFLCSASELKVGDAAPGFTAQTQDGKVFSLSERKGQWSVLYFYPKSETPGCTKQACAFRDSISVIRSEGAEIYGLSADTVNEQAAFHKNHNLNFTLLADPDSKIINLYGSQIAGLKMSKRWTFILDPELKIRNIEKDVDPAKDAERVAKQIHALKIKK